MIKFEIEKINEDFVTFKVFIDNQERHVDLKVGDVIDIKENSVELFRPSLNTDLFNDFVRNYP